MRYMVVLKCIQSGSILHQQSMSSGGSWLCSHSGCWAPSSHIALVSGALPADLLAFAAGGQELCCWSAFALSGIFWDSIKFTLVHYVKSDAFQNESEIAFCLVSRWWLHRKGSARSSLAYKLVYRLWKINSAAELGKDWFCHSWFQHLYLK